MDTEYVENEDIPMQDVNKKFNFKHLQKKVSFRFFVRLGRFVGLSEISLFSYFTLLYLVILGVSIGYAFLVTRSTKWLGETVLEMVALGLPPGNDTANATDIPPFADPTPIDFNPLISHMLVGIVWYALLGLGDTFFLVIQYILSLLLRIRITRNLSESYLQDTHPWALTYHEAFKIDNPDQRIANDIDVASTSIARVVTIGTKAIVILIYLTISYNEIAGSKATAVIYCVSIALMLMYRLLLKPYAKYTFRQEKLEGNFRYSHARIRDYAEAISFYEGESMEKENVENTLHQVVENQKHLAKWGTLFGIYVSLNQWIPNLTALCTNALFLWDLPIPAQTLARLYLVAGNYAGTIMSNFSDFMNLGIDVATFAGNMNRIVQLDERMTDLRDVVAARKPEYRYDESTMAFKNVTCTTPQKNYLVHNLNLEIKRGKSVIITGPSGCGKSSLLRCLVGLWKCEGLITRPESYGRGGLFYLPQKAYMVTGNLRDQVIYPDIQSKMSDEELLALLEKANIGTVFVQFGGWEGVQDWSKVLSPGEQQRLVFARLFYHHPNFAVLDESTSALDSLNEHKLYLKCLEMNITLISVAHKTALRQFHDLSLHFDGKGGYKVTGISGEEKRKAKIEKKWLPLDKKAGLLNLHSRDLNVEHSVFRKKKVKDGSSYLPRLWRIWKKMHCYEGPAISSILLVLLLITPVILAIGTAYWPLLLDPVLESIFTRDKDAFAHWFPQLCAAVLGTFILLPIGIGFSSFLSIRYRISLMKYLHDLYFSENQILKLNTKGNFVDNVDQRIAKSTADITAVVNPNGTYATFTLLVYAALVQITNPLSAIILLISSGLVPVVPAFFILAISIAAFLICLIFVYFMSNATYNKVQAEGDFRSDHIKVREYAEAICFHGEDGIRREKAILENSFKKVVKYSWAWILSNGLFNLVTSLLQQLATPASLGIILWVVITTGEIYVLDQNQLYGRIGSLRNVVSNTLITCIGFITILQPLSNNKGNVARIAQLIEAIEKNQKAQKAREIIHQDRNEGDHYSLDGLICVTPTGRELNRPGITARVNQTDRLLLMGPSGCGKSSLVRVLADLWQFTAGKLIHPPKSKTIFLPQKPYMVMGTLRDQIIYPHTTVTGSSHAHPDDIITKCLERANLGYLLNRYTLDDEAVWNFVLSPGEQQRLSFARLFYHTPYFAVLDESTSALDPSNEEDMYVECGKQGIGLISVGHRDSLMLYHNLLLIYDGKGGWELMKEDDHRGGRPVSVLMKDEQDNGDLAITEVVED